MKKKQNKKPKNLLAKYKAKKTKGDLAGTGIKTLVDLIAGATLGAGLGAGAGKFALPLGLVLIAGSHYMDEGTGILRLAGASSVAYGISKAIAEKKGTVNGYELAGEPQGVSDRLSQFKDELITAFYLNKLKKEEVIQEEVTEEIGAIDMFPLDQIEQNIRNEALRYEAESLPMSEESYEEELAFDLTEAADLTNI